MKNYFETHPEWEQMAATIAAEVQKNLKPNEKRFLKSAEARRMLGGISPAKLQSLRVGGHLPAINADGLWLYEYADIVNFTNKNKIGGEEAPEND